MNTNTEIYWAGVNENNNIWGYLSCDAEKPSFAKVEYYAFWGKMDGAVRFSRVYSTREFYSNLRKKRRIYNEIDREKIKTRIIDEFVQILTVNRLKYNY